MLLMLISALVTPLTLSLWWPLLISLWSTILGTTVSALGLTTILLLLVTVSLTLVLVVAVLLILLRRRSLIRVVFLLRWCLVTRVVLLLRGLIVLGRGVVLVLRSLVLVLVLIVGVDISPCVRTACAETLLPWLHVSFKSEIGNRSLTILPPMRSWAELRILAPGYRISSEPRDEEGTYNRDIVGSEYTLQTTTERSVIMLSTAGSSVVTQSLVSVVSYRIRSQPVQDLLLVSTTSVEPTSHLVEHHSLDLS